MNKRERQKLGAVVAKLIHSPDKPARKIGEELIDIFPALEEQLAIESIKYHHQEKFKTIWNAASWYNQLQGKLSANVFWKAVSTIPESAFEDALYDYLLKTGYTLDMVVSGMDSDLDSFKSRACYMFFEDGRWKRCLREYLRKDSTGYRFLTAAYRSDREVLV
ncbi:hypothetical protein EK599_05865 [Vibrio sp. T187]|uniref:hypothetical protein n=1 Tax=Vibrio TaxID=662 RepID=UPI0010C9D997|nr:MULTISPECIES: hypothetical protein [Vibrio]MBW3695210.1 hypothetical protein [Vibrio sp. T187]